MNTTDSIGERIKMVRENAGLSQKAFGNRVGLSQTAVTALENNQNEPRLSTFNHIIDSFRISAEWLRTGKGMLTKGQQEPEEAAQLTSGEATVEYAQQLASIEPMREVINGQAKTIATLENALSTKDEFITYLKAELGKFGGSLEAALHGLVPTGPRAGALATV